MSIRALQFIVKVTYACNADCSYCLVHKKAKHTPSMSIETFDLLLQRIKEYVYELDLDLENSIIDFLWIGGEPLLMDNDFYEYVYKKTIKNPFIKKIKITHGMQTNLINYSKDRFPILKTLLTASGTPFILGSSFDPFGNDRKLLNGDYNKKFIDAYFRLKEDGGDIGCIYVVTKDGIKKAYELYHFFKNLKVNSFTITSPSDYSGIYNKNSFGFSQKEYGEFLKELWKVWENDNFFMKITPFMGWRVLKEYKDESFLRCHNQLNCSKDIFGISPKGEIFECDNTMHMKHPYLGTLQKDSFKQIEERKILFDYKKKLKDKECAQCKWWDFCKGGCPYESKGYYQKKVDKTFWCESYKTLFEYVHKESK